MAKESKFGDVSGGIHDSIIAGRDDTINTSTRGQNAKTNPTSQEKRMIKILFLAANPSDMTRLSVDEESRAIDQALRQAEFREFAIEKHFAVRIADLQGLLLRHQPDIVHFSGHGNSANEIILEDNAGNSHPVSVNGLSQLFSVLKDNIRCVVLNACYSEEQAHAIAQHIDCVVGMSEAIGDRASISFATAFYQALGYGRDVKTAFELGRLQIDMENLGEEDKPRLLAITANPSGIIFVRGGTVSPKSLEAADQDTGFAAVDLKHVSPKSNLQGDNKKIQEPGFGFTTNSPIVRDERAATKFSKWEKKRVVGIVGIVASIITIVSFIIQFWPTLVTPLISPEDSKPAIETSCEYAVYVFNKTNSRPIRQAQVTVTYKTKSYVGFTDSEGYYRSTFPCIAGDSPNLRVRIEVEGYEPYDRVIALREEVESVFLSIITLTDTPLLTATDIPAITPSLPLSASSPYPSLKLTSTSTLFPITTLQVGITGFDRCPQSDEALATLMNYGDKVEFVQLEQPHITVSQLALLIRGDCSEVDQIRLTFVMNSTYRPRNIYVLDEITATTSALDLDRAVRLGRAIMQYSLNEYTNAAQNFEQLALLFQDVPTQDTLTFLYATSLLFDEKYEAAIAAYTWVEADDPLRVKALNNRGVAALNQAMVLGWFEDKTTEQVDLLLQSAKDSFTQALAAAKDNGIKAIILANRSATQYRFGGDLEQASVDCKQAISLAPADPIGYVCQAAVEFTDLEAAWCGSILNAEPARTNLAKAHALAPDYSFIYYWKGAIAELQGICNKDENEQERYQQEARKNYANYSKIINEQPVIFAMERQLLSMAESNLQ